MHPNCSQHTLIFKLKCNSLSKTPPKHSKHGQNIRNTTKHSKQPQNIRNTARTFETPQNIRNTPKHSKHSQKIRNTPTKFERTRTRGDEQTGTYGKDMHLRKRHALTEKTGTYGKDGNKAFKARFLHSRNNIAVTLGLTTKS